MKILKTVLERIRTNNLSLNMKKSSIYKESVAFLGHQISNGEISPDPERTRAILQFPTPRSINQLERFLGMTNYFRNYICHFSDFAKILYDMVKAVSLDWSKAALDSFNSIKESLSRSILVLPSPDEKLVLSTDASHECVVAVLLLWRDDLLLLPLRS